MPRSSPFTRSTWGVGQILYFGGDQHDPEQNVAHQFDATRLFDCGSFQVEQAPSPSFDVFCCGHALLGSEDDVQLPVAGGTEQFIFPEHPPTGEHLALRRGAGEARVPLHRRPGPGAAGRGLLHAPPGDALDADRGAGRHTLAERRRFRRQPLEPIELVDGARSDAGPWPYLLRWQEIAHGSSGWAVHQRGDGPEGPEGWVVRQIFTENPQYRVDFAVGNHFVASNDHSPFVTRPYVQRLRTDRHDTLDVLTWTTERPGRDPVKETVRPHEVPKLLDEVFGIRTDTGEAELLVSRLRDLTA